MLYKLERNDIETSSRVDIKNPAELGLTEKDIENFVSFHLDEFVSADQLFLLGQERQGLRRPIYLLSIKKEHFTSLS